MQNLTLPYFRRIRVLKQIADKKLVVSLDPDEARKALKSVCVTEEDRAIITTPIKNKNVAVVNQNHGLENEEEVLASIIKSFYYEHVFRASVTKTQNVNEI